MDLPMLARLCLIIIAFSLSACTAIYQQPNKEDILEANNLGSPIAISAISGNRNSADGIDVTIAYKNISNDPIKYVYFNVKAINAVGDTVSDTIRRKRVTTIKDTGPILPKSDGEFPTWKNAIYQGEAVALSISSATIVYMDGTKKEIKELYKLRGSFSRIDNITY